MDNNKHSDLLVHHNDSEMLHENYIPPYKYPRQQLKRKWIYSPSPKKVKINRKLGQDKLFKSQQTLRDIMAPALDVTKGSLPENDQTVSSTNPVREQASDLPPRLKGFNGARHLTQDKGSPIQPSAIEKPSLEQEKQPENTSGDNALEETVRGILKQLTHEIMAYEKNVAGLYGRIKEMGKENERLRQRYMLMCKDVVTAACQPADEKNVIQAVECTADEETSTSDDSDEEPDLVPLGKFSLLKGELQLLEGRILQNLHELKEKKNFIRVKSLPCNSLTIKTTSEETLRAKELKDKLDRAEHELKEVRKFAEVRVANLKVALSSETALRVKTKTAFDESREYVKKAAARLTQANEDLQRYQSANDSQKKIIQSLHNRLAGAESRGSNTKIAEVPGVIVDRIEQPKPYDVLVEKYNRISTAYTVLNSVSNMQNNDLIILNQQYEEEKLKNVSLMSVVEQQRKNFKPVRSGSISSESDAMKGLSKMYDDLCDERSKEAMEHEKNMKCIHDMYKKLLKKKDEEHHCAIENIAQELSEFRGLNEGHCSGKYEEQNEASGHFDIDKDLSSVEPDNTLIRITD